MRCLVFSLLLTAGATAYGQAGPTLPFSPGQPAQSPSWTWQGGNFGNRFGAPPPNWDALRIFPRTVIGIPPPNSGALLGDARVDPGMIVRPSSSRVGTLPQGQLVARNLYPGLKFQPIDDPSCGQRAEPLSTTWPGLKVKEIPTQWPGLRMEWARTVPIQGNPPEGHPSTR